MKPLSFGKDKTEIAKGVAILMMMWLHTFGSEVSIGNYDSFLSIGGEAFEYLLAKACNPVGLFMVLSGYGLYLSFLKDEGKASITQRMRMTTKRVLRIYIPWWITLAIGVPITYLVGMIETPFSWYELVCHLFAWNVSWNNVGWYILPFAIISYLMHFIFPSFKRHSLLWLAMGLISYYGINKIYGMCWDFLCQYQGLKILCRLFEFLFPMLLGASAARNRNLVLKIALSDKFLSTICSFGILLIFAISIYLKGIHMYPVYCAILVFFIVNACFSEFVSRTLTICGKHSLNIWFIHLYLIPFANHLKYSIVIYLTVVVGSLLSSFMIMRFSQPILRVFKI